MNAIRLTLVVGSTMALTAMRSHAQRAGCTAAATTDCVSGHPTLIVWSM